MILLCKSELNFVQRVSYIRSGDRSAVNTQKFYKPIRVFTFKRFPTNVYYVQYSWAPEFPDRLVFRTGHNVSITGSLPASGDVVGHRVRSVRWWGY
jgi:hypothetical protein